MKNLERALARERHKVALLEAMMENKTRELYSEKEQLRNINSYLKGILETLGDALIVTDSAGVVSVVNNTSIEVLGYERGELLGSDLGNYCSIGGKEIYEIVQDVPSASFKREVQFLTKDGNKVPVLMSCTLLKAGQDGAGGMVCVGHDLREQRLLEMRLLQAQKLESIGHLAAGIAHEINTPIQYVGDNTSFLAEAFGSIGILLDQVDVATEKAGAVPPEFSEAWNKSKEELDLKYIREEVPKAIQQSIDGVMRVAQIVKAMKEFSHPENNNKCSTNINDAVASTVTVSTNEWKYVAELEINLDRSLPAVPLYAGEFNQALLNVIVNAAHAIEDVTGKWATQKGKITISTKNCGDKVQICVSDTGRGIPEAIRSKIFNPFFTTKEVGRGTGQGLPMVRNCIEKRHGGCVKFESELGKGTTFILELPLTPANS